MPIIKKGERSSRDRIHNLSLYMWSLYQMHYRSDVITLVHSGQGYHSITPESYKQVEFPVY